MSGDPGLPCESQRSRRSTGYAEFWRGTGWLAYFTVFYPTQVIPLCGRIDRHLMRWARKKYQRLSRSDKRAREWLQGVRKRSPGLFALYGSRTS
jgi:hypothetical protein